MGITTNKTCLIPDIRTLSSAAKTLNELEKLLVNPKLLEIKFVYESSTNIKLFGKNIRLLAQERLLTSIADKNQASIASSLQVFYNLQCLPEIVMMVIDSAVKKTADMSRDALDFEALISIQPELGSGTGNSSSLLGPLGIQSTKKPTAAASSASSASSSASGGSATGPVTASPQLLMALREMGHLWSSIIHDNAMQMHSFQRVVAKKEDPTTHEKFLDVLKRVDKQSFSNNSTQTAAHSALVNGKLLDLFWHRLSTSLNDVVTEKIRAHPMAASRAYPFLRKAAVDLLDNLKTLTERDMIRDFHSGSSTGSSFLPTKEFTESLYLESPLPGEVLSGKRRDTGYVFGSLQWSQNDLLSTLAMGSLSRGSTRNQYQRATMSNTGSDAAAVTASRRNLQPNAEANRDVYSEHNLVAGLKPMKDRYLLVSLNRMTAPILQMFPEVEGYTGTTS